MSVVSHLYALTQRILIQLQVSVLVMIKMLLDDSLHHTYTYTDQPYMYFCCYGQYLISVLFWEVMPLFAMKLFLFTII